MKRKKKYDRISLLVLSALFIGLGLVGCNKPKGYKTESGLIFYVYNQNPPDSTVGIGSVLKLHYKKFVNDSLVENTYQALPKYEQVMSGMFYPYEAGEIYPFLHEGDSVILLQDADTLLGRRLFYQVPSYLSPGDKIVTHMKVVDVFPNDSTAHVDLNAEYPRAIERNRRNGKAKIQDYLKRHDISAEYTSDTIFIQRLEEGTGPEIQSGDVITLRFKIETFSGDVIGDNFGEDTDPIEYAANTGMMPVGVEQSLLLSKVGDHSRFYIPAMKGFGPSPPPGVENGFQDLIFGVKVIDKKDSKSIQ